MLELDESSLLVTLETHHRVTAVEKRLEEIDYTLGYYSPPGNRVTLKDALAQRAPNLYALKYGEMNQLCVALSWQGREGQIFQTRLTPRQATGPSWKALMVGNPKGSERFLKATFKIWPKPEQAMISLIGFKTLEDSFAFERLLSTRELFPRVFHRFSSRRSLRLQGLASPPPSAKPLEPPPHRRFAAVPPQLRKWVRHKARLWLALEWAGSLQEIDATLQEFERLASHHPHRTLENREAFLKIAPLFRKKIPEPRWGGIPPLISDEESLRLQQKLGDLLC